ncbi:MAG: PD40 domain-containing protein [Anaerolineales bacterium]|nr:PD40 domain-containing protein [Anaerolineales bacterium]
MKRSNAFLSGIILVLGGAVLACDAGFLLSGPGTAPAAAEPVRREAKIPPDAVKMAPATDPNPPRLLSAEFEEPVPAPGLVNTAGAEDSPFILPGGETLYFFFTPDASIPADRHIIDGVTGIYRSRKSGGAWGEAERVLLQDPGKAALDGCEFILGETMWFCTIREGYDGIVWMTAELREGAWRDWRPADFDPDFQVGELHISADGTELYFGSARPGGRGKLDLWVSRMAGGEWQEPANLAPLNTPDDEGWPALSPDGSELWFYRNYGIWRSKREGGVWGEAEQILSTLAGEPTLDRDGNLYFVHHYFEDDRMIEADIYVCYRK